MPDDPLMKSVFFDQASDGMVAADESGKILHWNRSMAIISGFERDEVIGRPLWEVMSQMVVEERRHLVSRAHMMEAIQAAVGKGQTSPFDKPYEVKLRRKDGSRTNVEIRTFPMAVDYGFEIGVVVRDISERINAEIKLKDQMERYRTIFENTGTSMLIVEDDLTISTVNDSFCKNMGITKSEVEWHMKASDFTHPGDLERMVSYHRMRRVDPSAVPREYELRLIDRKGCEHNAMLSVDMIPGTLQSVCAIVDITDIRRAYEELTRLERRTRMILDSINDGFLSVDEDSRITYFNDTAEKLLKRKRKDVLGLPLLKAFPQAKGTGLEQIYHEAITEGEPMHQEVFLKADPYEDWFEFRIYPQDRGASLYFQVTTERKRIEHALVEANHKLNLLNSLTRHDLKNQLMIVKGHLVLAENGTRNEGVRLHLHKALKASDHISRLLEFSKDYQGLGKDKPEWLNLSEVCTLGVAEVDLGDVVVEMDLDGTEVFADKMMEKVFHNLAANSVLHGEKTRTIRISKELRDGNLVIVYEDDGVGLPDQVKEEIFDESHGYHGLFLAKGVLEMTGIGIQEVGVPGEGARFEIFVPHGVFRVAS